MLLISTTLTLLKVLGQQNITSTFIHGIITHSNNQLEIFASSETRELSLPDPAYFFLPDSTGHFQISIPLNKSGYYRIGRNQLFLSANDTALVHLDANNESFGKFEGKYAKENEYLMHTPYPNAGSYLAWDSVVQPTIEASIKKIELVANQRKVALDKVGSPDSAFNFFEEGRIRADIINSILDLYYDFPHYNKLGEKDRLLFEAEFLKIKDKLISPWARDFVDARLLTLPVYRKISYTVLQVNKHLQGSDEYLKVKDYHLAKTISNKIFSNKATFDPENLWKEIGEVKNPVYKEALRKSVNTIGAFGDGSPAKDISAFDKHGTLVTLSSLKGKIVVIDVWATWCGPCIAGFPSYQKVKENFSKDDNVVVLTLSIDDDKEKWKKAIEKYGLTEPTWVVDRATIPDYQVVGIPRTIIIDKHFNIARFKAPLPEEAEEMVKVIKDLLKE